METNKQIELIFMLEALKEAKKAYLKNEVPIGAIIVKEGEIIGRGHNLVIALSDASAHAEILALREAGNFLNNYRLIGATLYCTLEPCLMCYTALVHARIKKIVYGAKEPKWGALGSFLDLRALAPFNHHIEVTQSPLKDKCGELMLEFFKKKRKN